MNFSEIDKSIFNNHKDIVNGDFSDLSKFTFPGVYIIIAENNDIIYVGNSYGRKIIDRIRQYLRPNDTGNTLLKEIYQKDYVACDKKYRINEIDKSCKEEIINKIKRFKIIAIPYDDLEYKLISICKPKYNTVGKRSTRRYFSDEKRND